MPISFQYVTSIAIELQSFSWTLMSPINSFILESSILRESYDVIRNHQAYCQTKLIHCLGKENIIIGTKRGCEKKVVLFVLVIHLFPTRLHPIIRHYM